MAPKRTLAADATRRRALFVLDRDTVARFLQETVFQTKLITDAFLGLSYQHSEDRDGGYCPVFRLNLTVTPEHGD